MFFRQKTKLIFQTSTLKQNLKPETEKLKTEMTGRNIFSTTRLLICQTAVTMEVRMRRRNWKAKTKLAKKSEFQQLLEKEVPKIIYLKSKTNFRASFVISGFF